MSNKYQVSGNKHFTVFILLGLVIGLLSYSCFAERDLGLGIGIGVFALFIIAVTLCIMPYQYRYEKQGVTICYLFLKNQYFRWKNVQRISIEDFSNSTHLFFWRVYQIHGRSEETPLPFQDGTISKTLRAKRLIEKYWKGTVEGYWDCNKSAKRKKNKQKSIKHRKNRF